MTRNCLSTSKIGDRRFPSAGKRLSFNVLIISGMLLSHLSRVSGRDGRCNNPGVLGGKGRINAGFPRIVAFLCNNPGEKDCFSGIIVVLRWPARLGETERGYGDTVILNRPTVILNGTPHCHPERNEVE